MSDELVEVETNAPVFGITKETVAETVAKAVIATLATAATTLVINRVAGALADRKNKTDDPS